MRVSWFLQLSLESRSISSAYPGLKAYLQCGFQPSVHLLRNCGIRLWSDLPQNSLNTRRRVAPLRSWHDSFQTKISNSFPAVSAWPTRMRLCWRVSWGLLLLLAEPVLGVLLRRKRVWLLPPGAELAKDSLLAMGKGVSPTNVKSIATILCGCSTVSWLDYALP